MLRKDNGHDRAIAFLKDLLGIVEVAPSFTQSAVDALSSEMKDFEDALQAFAARSCGTEILLTRNISDYQGVDFLSVLTPKDFMKKVTSAS